MGTSPSPVERITDEQEIHQRFDGDETTKKPVVFFQRKRNGILWFGIAFNAAAFDCLRSDWISFQGLREWRGSRTIQFHFRSDEGKPWTGSFNWGLEMLWCEPKGVFYTNIFSQEKGKKERIIRKRRITLTKGFFLGKL